MLDVESYHNGHKILLHPPCICPEHQASETLSFGGSFAKVQSRWLMLKGSLDF